MANAEALAKVAADKQLLVRQPVTSGLKTAPTPVMATAVTPDSPMMRAARVLGAVYKALAALHLTPLSDWAVPMTYRGDLSLSYPLVRGLAHAFPYAARPDSDPRNRAYFNSYWSLIEPLKENSLAWANDTLVAQRAELRSFKNELSANADALYEAAKKTVAISNTQIPAGFKLQEGESPGARYNRIERESLAKRLRIVGMPLLNRIFRHPDSVWMIYTLARERSRGMEAMLGAVQRSADAADSFGAELQAEPDKIWRFPPALVGGTVRLGIHQVEGMPEYAVAIGMVHGRAWWDRAFEHAGNAVLALEIMGGPLGAVVAQIFDVILAGLQWLADFLRAGDEDLAALATDFAAEDERMGKHMSGVEQAASLFATVGLAAAPYFPGGAKKLKGLLPSKVPDLDGKIPVRLSGSGVHVTDEMLEAMAKRQKEALHQEVQVARAEVATAEKQLTKAERDALKAQKPTQLSGEELVMATARARARAQVLDEAVHAEFRKKGFRVRTVRGSGTLPNTAHTGGISMIAERQIDRDVVEVAIHGEVVPGRLARDTEPKLGQVKAPNFNESKKLIKRADVGPELKQYEWAHLFGPGWGDEAQAGLMLAHPDINRKLQSLGPEEGLERTISDIATQVRAKGGTMRMTVTGRNFGGLPHEMTRGAPVLSEVKYEVKVIMPNGRTGEWTGEIVAPGPAVGAAVDFSNLRLGDLNDLWNALES